MLKDAPHPKLLVAIFLALMAVSTLSRVYAGLGTDFYVLWGVPAVVKLSHGTLGSPYANLPQYRAELREHAERSGDRQFKLLAERRPFFLTDTPLGYTMFALFGTDYSSSLFSFRVLETLFYLSGLILLGILYRTEPLVWTCLLSILFIGFGPLHADLGRANIGGLQFFCLTGVLAASKYLANGPGLLRAVTPEVLILTTLSFLALVKPNLAMISAILALHRWVRRGTRVFLASAPPTGLFLVVLFAVPCLYFGSWSIWADWYSLPTGGRGILSPGRIAAPLPQNASIAVMIASWLRAPLLAVIAAVAVLLVASLVPTLLLSRGEDRGPHVLRHSAAWLLDDPNRSLAVGIAATLALLPLAWADHYTLLLIPALWIATVSSQITVPSVLAISTILIASGMPSRFLPPLAVELSWVPLWLAILAHVLHGEPAAWPPGSLVRVARAHEP